MGEPISTVGKLAGVCGHDGTDWQKVSISASKRLKVEIDDPGGTDLTDILNKLTNILTELNAKLETGDLLLDAAKRAGVNLYGWDGSQARKLGLVWGYNNTVSQQVNQTNLPAGSSGVSGAMVPTGEVWVISTITGTVVSGTINLLYLQIEVDGTTVTVKGVTPPASGTVYLQVGEFILAAGDRVQLWVGNATAGDDAYLQYVGYKMQVNQ